jgi:hypothetical protein
VDELPNKLYKLRLNSLGVHLKFNRPFGYKMRPRWYLALGPIFSWYSCQSFIFSWYSCQSVIYFFKSNDSLLLKYTTFYHLVILTRWSFTLIYF